MQTHTNIVAYPLTEAEDSHCHLHVGFCHESWPWCKIGVVYTKDSVVKLHY